MGWRRGWALSFTGLGLMLGWAGSPAAHAAANPSPPWSVIQSVGADSVTVVRRTEGGTETQSIPIPEITVRAVVYPVPTDLLLPGERVIPVSSPSGVLLVLLPVARGTLGGTSSAWQLATPTGTLDLDTANALIRGLTRVRAGSSVEVYGTVGGGRIAANLLTSVPHSWTARVRAITPEGLTLEVPGQKPLIARFLDEPPELVRQLMRLRLGDTVVALGSPQTREIFLVIPPGTHLAVAGSFAQASEPRSGLEHQVAHEVSPFHLFMRLVRLF